MNIRLCIYVYTLIKRIGQDTLEIKVSIVYKWSYCAFFVTLTMVWMSLNPQNKNVIKGKIEFSYLASSIMIHHYWNVENQHNELYFKDEGWEGGICFTWFDWYFYSSPLYFSQTINKWTFLLQEKIRIIETYNNL